MMCAPPTPCIVGAGVGVGAAGPRPGWSATVPGDPRPSFPLLDGGASGVTALHPATANANVTGTNRRRHDARFMHILPRACDGLPARGVDTSLARRSFETFGVRCASTNDE